MQQYTTEHIIQYLRGQLSSEEQHVFEQALHQQASLQTQVRETEEALLLQKIEDYLADELPQKERQEFEQQVAENPDLQNKIQSVKRADQFLGDWLQADILDDVERIAHVEIDQTQPTSQTAPISPKRRRISLRNWGIAASLLFLSVFGYYFLYLPSQYSNQAIVEAVYEVYPGQGNLLSANPTDSVGSFYQAMALYDQAKYDQAIVGLQQITKSDPSYWMAQLYLGNALLAEQNPQAAIPVLTRIANQAAFQDQSLWYLALAQLQNGQATAASQSLDELLSITQDNFYRKKAQQVKEKMGHFSRKWPGMN